MPGLIKVCSVLPPLILETILTRTKKIRTNRHSWTRTIYFLFNLHLQSLPLPSSGTHRLNPLPHLRRFHSWPLSNKPFLSPTHRHISTSTPQNPPFSLPRRNPRCILDNPPNRLFLPWFNPIRMEYPRQIRTKSKHLSFCQITVFTSFVFG